MKYLFIFLPIFSFAQIGYNPIKEKTWFKDTVQLSKPLRIITGAGIGKVLTSGGDGLAVWSSAVGATGATGAVGATGSVGVTGNAGSNGATGVQGIQGVTGGAGTNGANGATGAVGATGVNGLLGITGATGSVGATGEIGVTGIAGATGSAGSNGVTGAAGITGVTGSNGTNGTNGVTGETGATGVSFTYLNLASNFSSIITTQVAVTGWSFAVTTGKTYRIEVIAAYQTAATTTGGELGIFCSASGAGTVRGFMQADIVSTAAATGLKQPITICTTADAAGSFLVSTGVTAINSPHSFYALVTFTCSASGTLNVGWASEVVASASQLNANSTLIYIQLN